MNSLVTPLSKKARTIVGHSPLFGRFMVLKMRNFLRGALPRTPLGLPAPDPRLGLCPRPRVRRCRRPEAELRLQAKVARCRLSSKKIAMWMNSNIEELSSTSLSMSCEPAKDSCWLQALATPSLPSVANACSL